MNSKDLNLASHIKEILDSGCVDSVKIEGRTKTSYYAAITARTYRWALDDYYNDVSHPDDYQRELHTMQNRGFTDAYLIHRPFEKHDDQNLDYTMMMGPHQVTGMVTKEGTHFMCKYKTFPNDILEIVAPKNSIIALVDNDIGSVTCKDDGRYYISFKELRAENGKIWESVHSGNVNPIRLPIELPAYTFFRIPATEDMMTAPPKI